jgi:hypothetical protein
MITKRRFIFDVAKGLIVPFTGIVTRAAVGDWNGIAFTALNGIAQTSWNGTGISCASGGCTTAQDANTGAQNSNTVFANSATLTRSAFKFVPASGYTICKCDMYLSKNGSPTFTFQGEIWSHDGGGDLPLAQVGSGGTIYNASTAAGAEAVFTVAGLSVALTSGTTYWFALKQIDASSAGNNLAIYRNSTIIAGPVNNIASWTAATGLWTSGSTSRRSKFQTYS